MLEWGGGRAREGRERGTVMGDNLGMAQLLAVTSLAMPLHM